MGSLDGLDDPDGAVVIPGSTASLIPPREPRVLSLIPARTRSCWMGGGE